MFAHLLLYQRVVYTRILYKTGLNKGSSIPPTSTSKVTLDIGSMISSFRKTVNYSRSRIQVK